MRGQVEEPDVKAVVAVPPKHEEDKPSFVYINKNLYLEHSRAILSEYKRYNGGAHLNFYVMTHDSEPKDWSMVPVVSLAIRKDRLAKHRLQLSVWLACPHPVQLCCFRQTWVVLQGGLSIPVHGLRLISPPLLCQDPPPQPTEASVVSAEAKALAFEAPSSKQLS